MSFHEKSMEVSKARETGKGLIPCGNLWSLPTLLRNRHHVFDANSGSSIWFGLASALNFGIGCNGKTCPQQIISVTGYVNACSNKQRTMDAEAGSSTKMDILSPPKRRQRTAMAVPKKNMIMNAYEYVYKNWP
ncbi:hypothetical protein EVAR_36325_1 [Eumeta japonica]|uniref:Uncharacterized protein n=1 Tax=Eumeta variegata TaxID=151549 RepID=A0A4C1VJ00_EUMVA|nr:hypothetical protein EVAR_36325_1 [Eumeta japonica]